MKIFDDIKTIKGIGDKTARLFNKLGVFDVENLIHFYPRSYVKYEECIKSSECENGVPAAFLLTVINSPTLKNVRGLSILNALTSDGENKVAITFFNSPYLKSKLIKGAKFVFYGKMTAKDDAYLMEQPKVFTLFEYENLRGVLNPVYPLTKGLSNNQISKTVKELYENGYFDFYQEYLPKKVIERFGLICEKDALYRMHFPNDFDDFMQARKRLVFDELFLFLYILRRENDINTIEKSDFPLIETSDAKRLIERLPYNLTNAQKRVFDEITSDMTGGYSMNRMIQGDVGSGKTIVAFLSLLLCVSNNYQGAMMAPTEILAKQHFENLSKMISEYDLPIKADLLTGSTSAKEKKRIYEDVESGKTNVLIGTHALIFDKVVLKNLALVITDEQHRFGVKQRENLTLKGKRPHVLVMSATPIPRSLSMVLYGDMHLSVLDEKPQNRTPIKNCVVNTTYRKKAYEFITKEVNNHHQVYVICPMVNESDGLPGVCNVTDYSSYLKEVLPPFIRVDVLHGKMKNDEKSRIMNEFAKGNIDVLVSTTVIEVGIDVPNATVIMIENAERFGLSTLHQLRGRVGRSDLTSYAIFINGNPKNPNNKRLEILNNSNDGFFIANEDLRLRGAGDVFGIRQSGHLDFELADIYEDSDMIMEINDFLSNASVEDMFENDESKFYFDSYVNENIHKFIDFKTI